MCIRDSCYTKQWWRFGLGRVESGLDACGLEWLEERFAADNGTIEDLLVGMTLTPSFLYRTVQDPSEPDLVPDTNPGGGN